MTYERMYQKILKTDKNKAPKGYENVRKTHKTDENSSSKTYTKITVFKQTEKTETGAPADQNHLVF